LFYFYEILTTFLKLKIMSDMLFYFYETLTTFNKLKLDFETVLRISGFYKYKL
jgi:hypothetical protein